MVINYDMAKTIEGMCLVKYNWQAYRGTLIDTFLLNAIFIRS